jgi:hypothetical protein
VLLWQSLKLIKVAEERIRSVGLSRRRLLRKTLCVGASAQFNLARSLDSAGAVVLSQEDKQFLEHLEKASFLFFWEQANPETGLVKDRCNVRASDNGMVASIAATGFGLTALCIGQENGWVSLRDARDRAIVSLRFLAKKMPTHRGFSITGPT